MHKPVIEQTPEFAGYNDLALVLAWPDVTARGDERWYMWLKKMGIVKNLNFKVGHAAIILISRDSGEACYYDFGRYITPRGYGRARSAFTDPALRLHTVCQVEGAGDETRVVNLPELLEELEANNVYTHGDGVLYCSLAPHISFYKARLSADAQYLEGCVIYSAFAKGNNNCSRFVEQVLKAGLPEGSVMRWQVDFPETFVASPISNVINARKDHLTYTYRNGELRTFPMGRIESLRFFLRQVSANFFWGDYLSLSDDSNPGYVAEPRIRPAGVPTTAQWLGGVGEGGWHELIRESEKCVILKRYTVRGELDFDVEVRQSTGPAFNPGEPYRFVYDTHAMKATIEQNGQKLCFETVASHNSAVNTSITEIHYAS